MLFATSLNGDVINFRKNMEYIPKSEKDVIRRPYENTRK